ncbi:MAG: ATP-binding protein [Gammaproteobacteria bacterium]
MHTDLEKPEALSSGPVISHEEISALQTWKPLQFLNLYRLLLAGLIATLCATQLLPKPLGEFNQPLFFGVSFLYLAFSIVNILTIRWQNPSFNSQVYAHIFVDILAITLLMHASGGVTSGLGMLMVVAIAGSSILMAGRTAILFAAIATMAVLTEQIYSQLEGTLTSANYPQAGLLGASFFATAVLAHVLARRLRDSEALAERRGIDLENMAQLTEYVIQRMQTGIMVIDYNKQIRLINESASKLLDNQDIKANQKLTRVAPKLAEQLDLWLKQPYIESDMFRASETSPEIKPRFANLGRDKTAGTLVFLEDIASTTQQAQQMKLASLGRLTASIAHEIRNPLGAISHAGQLLKESPHFDPGDTRLTEIIDQHSKRVNAIIENIMQLSRRDHSNLQIISLKLWIESFIADFIISEDVSPDLVRVNIDPEDAQVHVDPTQLHQIMWNLVQNGLLHGADSRNPIIEIKGGLSSDSHSPFIEVVDHGPGIEPDMAQQIFEPFFTTKSKGTGLGLYISKELCESNHSRLNYYPTSGGGCSFRITFADSRRRQVA